MIRSALRGLVLIAATASLGFAPAPLPKAPKVADAVKALYGDWHNPSQPTVVVSINETEFAYVNSGLRNNVYKLTLDATKKPMWYDIRKPGANFVGLIKVEGDTLTVLYNSEDTGIPGGRRPANFDSAGHREIYYRVKKKK
jgi:uncharacterized protein (TIGR03067 family)